MYALGNLFSRGEEAKYVASAYIPFKVSCSID